MRAASSGYTGRILNYPAEASDIGRLRYEVFVRQLGWVVGDRITETELDQLDGEAIHLGVYDHDCNLNGYARLIRGGGVNGMLLQQPEFRSLLPNQFDVGPTTAEVSRLCISARGARLRRNQAKQIQYLLFRMVYEWAISGGVSTLYATVNDDAAASINKAVLERLLLFRVVGGPHQFKPGVNTYLMMLDLTSAAADPRSSEFFNL